MSARIHGINLTYDDVGTGPAVVMLHDLPLCRRMWQPQIGPIAEHGYRVIAPDLRGFGETDCGVRPFSLQLCADDVASLLKYLGVGRAVFVGTGASVHLVREFHQRHSHRMVAACLIAPESVRQSVQSDSVFSEIMQMIRSGKRLSAIDRLCQNMLPDRISQNQQERAWIVQSWMEKVDSEIMLAVLDIISSPSDPDMLNVPTLLVSDKRSRINDTASLATEGHCLQEGFLWAKPLANLEWPEKINALLIGFLDHLSMAKPKHHKLAAAA